MEKPIVPKKESHQPPAEVSREREASSEAVEQFVDRRAEDVAMAVDAEKDALQEAEKAIPGSDPENGERISKLQAEVDDLGEKTVKGMEAAEGLPTKLERYDYIVPPDPAVRARIDAFFDRGFIDISEGERGEGRDLVDQMNFLQESATDWAKTELGIDPTARLPQKEKIAVVSLRSLREKTENPTRVGCANNLSREMMLGEELETDLPYAFNHEMVHQLSAARRKTRFDPRTGFLTKVEANKGYRTATGKFQLLNEALTDLVNMEILQSVKDRHGQDYLQVRGVGYAPEAILLDALIKKTGEASGQGEQFRKDLYRGLFTGDVEVLRTMEQNLGKGTLARLVDAQPETYAELAKLGGELGLDEEKLRQAYRRLRRGKKVTLANNISVSMEPHKERWPKQ